MKFFPILVAVGGFLLASASFLVAEDVERVRVDSRAGTPTITVNGKVARPRFIYCAPGSRPVWLEEGIKKHFDFILSPKESAEGNGTIHFRFGYAPGTIRLDDFSIIDTETGRELVRSNTFETDDEMKDWSSWASVWKGTRVANISRKDGALEIEILPELETVQCDFHVFHAPNLDLKKGGKYRIRFSLESSRERQVISNAYRPANPYVWLGTIRDKNEGVDVFHSQIQMAGESGARFVTIPTPSIWSEKEGEACDYAELDKLIERVLEANPDALIIPRISMNPPEWWLEKHPEDRMIWRGLPAPKYDLSPKQSMATPSSRTWREDGKKVLAAAIQHLEEKYGPHIGGYHPTGQNTAEWFTYNTWHPGRAGYSACNQRVWREWVQEKYGTETALQKAWKRPAMTFKTVEVPTIEMWKEAQKMPILTDRMLLDYHEFMQIQMTDTVLAFSETAREASGGKKLVVIFYGYAYEFSGASNGPAYSAHYALQRLLDSPSIDIICSPQSYFDRQAGGGGQCMLCAESVALSGKMYLLEDDTRTHLTPSNQQCPGYFDGADTMEGACELLRRNTAECACRNFATWWMDLGATGWYADPELWKEMKALAEMDRWFIENPTQYTPEVAVFIDENVMLRISHGKFSEKGISWMRGELSRMGASYGQYFTNDLISGKIQKLPKMCVMLHAELYTPEERGRITQAVGATGENTLFWVSLDGSTVPELREEALKRGVHLYTDAECNVWANGPFIVIHSSQDGLVKVTPRPGFTVMTDEMTGETVSGMLEMKKGETRVLRCLE